MSASTPSRFGQANSVATSNGDGADQALFLKVFGGEVLTAFEQNTIMLDKHNVRTISSGKSAQFPTSGRITAAYHTPGAEILGDEILFNEVVITIDQLLLASAFISNIDEAMSHYDVRSIFTTEMGRKLATCFDQSLIMEGFKGAVAAPTTGTGLIAAANKHQHLGASYDGFSVANKAAALATAIFAQAAIWDNYFIPGERYCLLLPVDYNALIQNTTAINADWGGAGAYSDGTVFKVGGVNIIKAPQMTGIALTDTSSSHPTSTYHGANFATGGDGADLARALMFTKEALGTVKLMDLSSEAAYDIRRQGTLMVSKYAMGHGVLRPDCLAVFAADAS